MSAIKRIVTDVLLEASDNAITMVLKNKVTKKAGKLKKNSLIFVELVLYKMNK